MIKNLAGQTIELYAYDYSTGAPKTGDAANLTFYIAKDGGSATALGDSSASEISSTNAPGWYRCDVTQAESNFDNALFSGKSSTSNIVVVGRPVSTFPTYLAEMIARFLSMVEAASGSPSEFRFTADALTRVQTVIGQASGNLDAQLANLSGRLPAALVGGKIDANVGSFSAGAITEAAYSTTAGTFAPLGIIDQGTAQGATSTTLQLRSAAAFANDEIIGAVIEIVSASTGAGQSRTITDYVGSTDTATVDAWTTTPTGTIVYKIFAAPPADGTASSIKAVTDKLNTMLGNASGSPGDYVFLADALVNAPTGGLSAAGVRAAVGLASANLDTQLSTLSSYVDTEVAAIKVNTDKLGTMLEPATGSPGDYRYSYDALRNAPTGSGGGGGGSGRDFSDGELDQIRYRLGIDGTTSVPSATPNLATAAALASVASNVSAVKVSADALFTTLSPAVGSPGDYKFSADALRAIISVVPTAVETADAVLARDIGSGSNAGSSEERTVRSALRFLRNKWSISGSTLTVRKEDDTTAAWTSTVATTAGADPVTGNDPT